MLCAQPLPRGMFAVALLLPLCCVWRVLDKPRHSTLCLAGTGQTQTQHIVSGGYWTNPDTAHCVWRVLDKPRHTTLCLAGTGQTQTQHIVWQVLGKPRLSTLCLAGTGQTQTWHIVSGRYWTNPDTAHCIWQVLDKPKLCKQHTF